MANGGNGRFALPEDLSGDVIAQRRIARELLAESEAVGNLLASDTAALGSDEVTFLARLRDALLARGEELGSLGGAGAAVRPPHAPPQKGTATMSVPEPAPKTDTRGGVDIARLVVVCYLMFLFAFMGYLFAKSHLLRVDVTGDIVEMFKVFLLPTVMLVLGFAFGSRRD